MLHISLCPYSFIHVTHLASATIPLFMLHISPVPLFFYLFSLNGLKTDLFLSVSLFVRLENWEIGVKGICIAFIGRAESRVRAKLIFMSFREHFTKLIFGFVTCYFNF